MQRKKSFLVVYFSILMGVAGAQSRHPLMVDKIVRSGYFTAPVIGFSRPVAPLEPVAPPFRLNPAVQGSIPGSVGGDFYSNHLGFFCQKELEIQKVTHLPVFFRLGSLDYVNKLEGK